MDEIIITRIADVPGEHQQRHNGYECHRRSIVPRGAAKQCALSVYEVPPGKSAFPYHYHSKNEEIFYIVSGSGILKTPKGEKAVSAGDFLFFPACENGAHKLTNRSETEQLIYMDFDTENDLEAVFYPDSGKIGIWGKNINQLFRTDTNVGYYDGE